MSTFKLPESQKVYKRATDKQLRKCKLPRVVWCLLDLLEEEMNVSSLAIELNLSEADTQMIIDECLKRKLVIASAPEELSYDDYFSCEERVSCESAAVPQTVEETNEDVDFTLEEDDPDVTTVDIDFEGEEFAFG